MDTQKEQAPPPSGRPTIVRTRDGGRALVKTIGGRRVVIRRYPPRRVLSRGGPQAGATGGSGSRGNGANGNGNGSRRGPLDGDLTLEEDFSTPVVEVTPVVQQLPLAPLSQEAAEKLNERAVSSVTKGIESLSGILETITVKLQGNELISRTQIEVLTQIATNLRSANERSEALAQRLSAIPDLFESMRQTIVRLEEGAEQRDVAMGEFRLTMESIQRSIEDLTGKQVVAMDRMTDGHIEAINRLSKDHSELVTELSREQQRAVEKITAGHKEAVLEVNREQQECIRSSNEAQISAFERTHELAMRTFSDAQLENIGAFAKAQSEQARNMSSVLERSHSAYRMIIVIMVVMMIALVGMMFFMINK